MLFGPKLTTVFASRWKAAFWAATILISAYGIATGETGQKVASGEPVVDPTALNGIDGAASSSDAPAANPWAINSVASH